MTAYTRMDGKNYYAELTYEEGKHIITIRNKTYKTEVERREACSMPQWEMQALLRKYDSKPPFENGVDE